MATANGACPEAECDYYNPQYLTSATKWITCAKALSQGVIDEVQKIAAEYPRFDAAYAAYAAYRDELHQAAQSGSDTTTMYAIRRRFEDGITQSAEPEAVQAYNTVMLTSEQHPAEKECGPAPSPPKKTP